MVDHFFELTGHIRKVKRTYEPEKKNENILYLFHLLEKKSLYRESN